MKKPIIFVDFDGTIITTDTIGGSVQRFVDKDTYYYYGEKLQKGEMTLSHVIQFAFNQAPSSMLPKLLEFVDGVEIREGFGRFLDAMQALQIPVVVVSGGVRQFMERKLQPYMDKITAIHACDLDVSGPTMRLISPHDNGDELLAKREVMAQYDYDFAFGIGDSLTDLNMAQAVDMVFARDVLAQFMEKKHLPYTAYEDFDVITEAIRKKVAEG